MARFVADGRFVATRELFERARERVTVDDVRDYAPRDPGVYEYIAAFTAIVHRGQSALSREFAVTETIGLTRWTHADSQHQPKRFRWFRILTCAAEILIAEGEHRHYGLAALLVDSFMLAHYGDKAAPLDLLSAVCRELAPEPLSWGEEELGFCVLGQLLLAGADRLGVPAIEVLCAALQPHLPLWDATNYDQLHPVWLDLVEKHFPIVSPETLATRKRLLTDGAPWLQEQRVLS